MASKTRNLSSSKPLDPLRFSLMLVLAVGALYLAKSVILPLAFALLLTFILTPLVVWVQRFGFSRIPAVLIVLGLTVLALGGVSYGVGTQLAKLADELPIYVGQVNQKINRAQATSAGPIGKAIAAFQGFGEAAHKPATQPIVVSTQQASAIGQLSAVALTVVEPLADVALICILVAFMLIRREDLRNRVIGLLGHGRLTGTTRVFVESAERISRLLLMQLCVNTSFGIIFGLLLLCLGVQYWFLWGFLTVVLRFVPYVGSWLAAMLPVLLSFATAPGWGQPLAVFISFMMLDLVTANVIEPLLFGHSTGVTPVALLIAAVFWTWVWGPLGLVLSTPLTVCLVVMGQNVPSFRFLSLLMGDEAALEPHVAYYQRLLAGDRPEAVLVAKEYGRSEGWDRLPDGVVLPALRMARRDRDLSGLSPEDETFIYESTDAVIHSLCEARSPQGAPGPGALVLGCAAHHRAEELTLQLLACVLSPACCMEVISTRVLPSEIEARVDREKPSIVYIAVLPPGGLNQARHLCRRLSRRFADVKIVVGYFGKTKNFDQLLTRFRDAGASYVSTSIAQSRSQIIALLPAIPAPGLAQEPAIASNIQTSQTSE